MPLSDTDKNGAAPNDALNFKMPIDVPSRGLSMRDTPKSSKQQASGTAAVGSKTDKEIFEWARQFNQEGSDPSAPGFEVGNGATALHAAVENGHFAVSLVINTARPGSRCSLLTHSHLYS
eukprot:m.174829 g.174829  ORF g.174829 m.174829 type:complete len:120 (-) comp14598_c0_seq18:1321-1680(-)